ncbi:hypothetical protein FHS11_005400 [Mucilaginibacter gotjawali]|uniref:Uncharacterized protein n=1 Tax=Mucilaginibacter gotjawali TaxID=1550579 RepID=A0A839SQ40_9SPHI|nr:hypothetical protein [Mucilaginibacter gotjawali]
MSAKPTPELIIFQTSLPPSDFIKIASANTDNKRFNQKIIRACFSFWALSIVSTNTELILIKYS